MTETKPKKHINPTCQHLGFSNERDCENESEYMCQCCAAPVCQEHKEKCCPYGGMGYVELDD